MKILLSFAFIFVFAFCVSAMPLVFRATKELKKGMSGDILTFDSSKYKKLRIGVSIIGVYNEIPDTTFKIEAVEGVDLILINSILLNQQTKSASISITELPSKIKLSADTYGTYKIFIWAE